MATTETEFGTVHYATGMEGVAIVATGAQLYAWAHRTGAAWPCSVLAELGRIRVEFDSNGLSDLESDDDTSDLSSAELSAWSADVLRDVLPPLHPAYFATVGQYLPKLTCPECGEEVWDGPFGSKLAKCWNMAGHADGGTLAFTTMEEA